MRQSPVVLILILTAVFLAGRVSAEPRLATNAPRITLSSDQVELRGPGRIALRPDARSYEELYKSGTAHVTGFPLPDGSRVDLEISRTDLVHGNTRYYLQDASGIRQVSGPSARFFRGRVAGDPDSLVSLNMVDGRIAGFVRAWDNEYTFGPGSFADLDSGKRIVSEIEIRDQTSETETPGTCEGHRGPMTVDFVDTQARRLGLPSMASTIDGNTLLLASVAVEGTVEWTNKHGGVAGAQAYTLNLLAQVSTIYENDLKVQLQVPYLLMNAAEPDGYSNQTNNSGTVLDELMAKWNSTPALRNVFRSSVHVFGTLPSGGSGIAYVNVLCDGVPPNSNSFDFGVSLLSGNGGSWERSLVAHELGHNFSSPHTHCYSPEIDQCYGSQGGCYTGPDNPTVGTIMSYCGSSTDTFHPRVINEKLRPAAEAAYPTCLSVAGQPGGLQAETGNGLEIGDANICTSAMLSNDDGGGNGAYGYNGTTLATWAKRFTPACYPYKLTDVEVRIASGTVAAGRPLQVLIYADTTGTGPATASLIHSQNETVQVVSSSQWNQFTLTNPVVVGSGDIYIGFHDLDPDSSTTYIMDYDNSRNGDSFWQAGGISAGDFGSFPHGTFMIRGSGEGVVPGSLFLSWGLPCNDATVPNQDFAVYQGALGNWTDLTNLTCSTGFAQSWFLDNPGSDLFWLIVPQNSANEGSYGASSFGERLPATAACKPQAIGACQ